jgi:ComF family protein
MAPLPLARALVERALDLLAPEVCAACDARVPPFTAFCPDCAATLEPPGKGHEGDGGAPPNAIAAFAYGGALVRAITSFKYARRADRARPLAHALRRAIAPLRGDRPSLVVPVPLHRTRLAERGFNQAALLAAPVARDLGVPLAARALARVRDTTAQASLDREARLSNVDRAFVATRRVDGADVLLLDDVRTTGATLRACERALVQAGAARVRSLVLAAADDA